MKRETEQTVYAAPRTRFVGMQLEPFCASEQQEGNNGTIDDLVDFEDVWY